jgi:hypothetical protein
MLISQASLSIMAHSLRLKTWSNPKAKKIPSKRFQLSNVRETNWTDTKQANKLQTGIAVVALLEEAY